MAAPDDAQTPGSRGESPPGSNLLSLRVRLLGGLLIFLFLALFTVAVTVYISLRLSLPTGYFTFWLTFVIAADLVLLGLFADYRLRTLVLVPVDEMVVGAERIAGGDQTHRLPESDTAELQRLAAAVNSMADGLIHNQELLAANVQSLEETNRELSETQTRLVRAEKLASIGRLASGIAHEVGNPLAAIFGYLEMGRRGEHPSGEWTQGIRHEAGRIDRIVRGLLDYAKPRAAAMGAVEVGEVIDRTVDMLSVQGRFESISFRLSLAEGLPPAHADAHQLEQVLVNLLLNAADAISEGREQGTIEVTTGLTIVEQVRASAHRRLGDPDGLDYKHLRRLDSTLDPGPSRGLRAGDRAVEVRVADDGPGIPADVLNRVFEPFFTTKAPGRGTGLGLAVSARMIEGMGGTIDVVDTGGVGAALRVLLPLSKSEGDG